MRWLKGIILFFVFASKNCDGFTQIINVIPPKNDSIAVHIESCFCFMDSSSGVKKANCYFAIYNHGKQKIFLPQKLRHKLLNSTGQGLEIYYEVLYIGKDTIDVLKDVLSGGHPFFKIDKRTVDVEPDEEYYVRISLSDLYFPYAGKYRIRFRLEPENKKFNSGTKGLKKEVYSKWVNFEWPNIAK